MQVSVVGLVVSLAYSYNLCAPTCPKMADLLALLIKENERCLSLLFFLAFSLNSSSVHGQVKDRVKGGHPLLQEADP